MKKLGEKVLFQGNWLTVKEMEFLHKNQSATWECIVRKNTSKIVVVLALAKPSNRYVLIKQFRPAINNYVIGFPAGLAETDDIEKEALKELKEETGFSGKITKMSPKLAFNPALSDEIVYIVEALIDERNPGNLNPKQQLEHTEEIEVVLVDKKNVKNFLQSEQQKGADISVGLWYLFGFNL